jgi:hypothetical protein
VYSVSLPQLLIVSCMNLLSSQNPLVVSERYGCGFCSINNKRYRSAPHISWSLLLTKSALCRYVRHEPSLLSMFFPVWNELVYVLCAGVSYFSMYSRILCLHTVNGSFFFFFPIEMGKRLK